MIKWLSFLLLWPANIHTLMMMTMTMVMMMVTLEDGAGDGEMTTSLTFVGCISPFSSCTCCESPTDKKIFRVVDHRCFWAFFPLLRKKLAHGPVLHNVHFSLCSRMFPSFIHIFSERGHPLTWYILTIALPVRDRLVMGRLYGQYWEPMQWSIGKSSSYTILH